MQAVKQIARDFFAFFVCKYLPAPSDVACFENPRVLTIAVVKAEASPYRRAAVNRDLINLRDIDSGTSQFWEVPTATSG